MSLEPGDLLGPYKVQALLGRGGMGEVYRARDTRLGRDAALKVIAPKLLNEPNLRRRFHIEARAASVLNHPAIVTIYDVGEVGEVSWIAMEWVEGRTLRQVLSEGSLAFGQVLSIAREIAEGLAAAHAKGIVHRDLKPDNIMLRADGRAKILDFGLARQTVVETMETASIETAAAPTGTKTFEGAILGTVGYMSPEQASGRPADFRSDQFTFGLVVYEMLTGRRAFERPSTVETLAAIIREDPVPVSSLRGGIPEWLQHLIARCLAKRPEDRFASTGELAAALETSTAATPAPPLMRPDRRAAIWIGTAILVVAGLLLWQLWSAGQRIEPLRAVPLTTLPGVKRYPSFSPDGNYVVFTWTGPRQDNTDIYVQQIGSGAPLRLTSDLSRDFNPAWSPDGRWIAFLRTQSGIGNTELRLIAPLGGPERRLAEVRPPGGLLRPFFLTWCPDSQCMVVTDSPGAGKPAALFVVSLETGAKRQLTNPQPPVFGDTEPAVSPDGRWLVFRRNAAPFTGELHRLPVGRGLTAIGEPRRLTLAALNASNPAWMPDSKEILFSAKNSLWRLAISAQSAPTRLPFVGEDGLMPAVSRSERGRSRLVYIRSFADLNIWRVETSAPNAIAVSRPVVSISSTRSDYMPDFSPDGRRVVFGSDRTGESELWLADPDGSNAVQLTSQNALPGSPRWSPDGELIAFHSNPEGQAEIYVVPAAGGKPRNLTAHPALDAFPSFSRDRKWIYFSSNRTGADQIWKIPQFGGDAIQVTNNVGSAALPSPDGAYIYYVQAIDRPSPLWRVPTSGGAGVKVLERVDLVSFVILHSGIYYTDRSLGEARVQWFDFATRRSTTVAGNLGDVGLLLTASPDGRAILYTRRDASIDDLMLVENFR